MGKIHLSDVKSWHDYYAFGAGIVENAVDYVFSSA